MVGATSWGYPTEIKIAVPASCPVSVSGLDADDARVAMPLIEVSAPRG